MTRLRFQKHQHMRAGAEFDRVFQGGSRARSDLFTIAVRPNGHDHSRLGLSVGKRIWKGAVQRNYVRRVFREAFRTSQHELPPGIDIIMIPSRPKLAPDLAEAQEQLVAMARKALRRFEEKEAKRIAQGSKAEPRPARS
jgi:ribonuclease P protein component